MNWNWNTILSSNQIDEYHKLTASLDPSFAAREREFYKSRTVGQLKVLAAQAWRCNERGAYVLANSYLAEAGR